VTAAVSNYRVVLVDTGYAQYEAERSLLSPLGAELVEARCGGQQEAIADAVREADLVLVREAPLTRETIYGMTRARGIIRYGVGVDNIDLGAARERRIYVANVPDYGSDDVAEHALALMLSLSRRITQRDRAVRAGAWGVGQREVVHRLSERTLGLVGFGRIARALQAKTSGLGLAATLAFDPVARDFPAGVEAATLPELLARADLISLHAPLTAETRHLLGEREFAALRPGTLLVNTARGGLIDEAALLAALQSGQLSGAGLDVFENEPLAPEHPLRALDNVILTDHAGWYSEESLADLQRLAGEEAVRILSGASPRSWVNPWTS
jgi:D-3-phosphoglycerate dehydrogenase